MGIRTYEFTSGGGPSDTIVARGFVVPLVLNTINGGMPGNTGGYVSLASLPEGTYPCTGMVVTKVNGEITSILYGGYLSITSGGWTIYGMKVTPNFAPQGSYLIPDSYKFNDQGWSAIASDLVTKIYPPKS